MHLRSYQQEALLASLSKFREGVTKQLLVLPTGMGKTVVFASLPQHHQLPGKMLVLVHRDELASQAVNKIGKWNPSLRIGIEMGKSHSQLTDDVIVASVPTIGKENSARLHKFVPEHFSMVVVDESHHSVATPYKRVFEHFGFQGKTPTRLLLGVTATPNRGDKQALGLIYDEIIYQYPLLKAIQDGWLSNMRGLRIATDTNLDGVHTRSGDFVVGELEAAVNTPGRNDLIARKWLEHAGNVQTLAFTVDIQHAKDLALAFKNYGVCAEAIWGVDPDREEKLKAHRKGQIKVLCNCAVLTEGYDDWQIACIVLARPTKSQLAFVQMAGRGTRIPEGINNLKEAKAARLEVLKDNCLLMDVVDNTSRHSLVTLSSLFGLNPRLDMKSKPITKVLEDMEKIEGKHLGIDLSELEDFDRLNAYAEEVDLFTVRFAPEVVDNSNFQWFKTGPALYKLHLPSNEQISINRNILDRWEVEGSVRKNKFKETQFIEMHDAFVFADKILELFGRNYLTTLRREANWHEEPATAIQLSFLRKFNVHPQEGISKENARKLISQTLQEAISPNRKPKRYGTNI